MHLDLEKLFLLSDSMENLNFYGKIELSEPEKKTCRFSTWIPDLGAFQPVLGRKFHVESEFEVRNKRFKRPEGKNKEKRFQIFVFLNTFFIVFTGS